MIVVRVELHSAISKTRSRELARMVIHNDGTGTLTRRNYKARTLIGRGSAQLNKNTTNREVELKNWPSQRLHVWYMVARLLNSMGYDS